MWRPVAAAPHILTEVQGISTAGFSVTVCKHMNCPLMKRCSTEVRILNPFPLTFAPDFTTLEDGVLHWEGEDSGVMISTSPEVEAAELETGGEMSTDESVGDQTRRRRSGRRKGKGGNQCCPNGTVQVASVARDLA